MARKLLSRPKYLKTLKKKLDDCTLHPSIHSLLLQYGFGRPKEVIESVGGPVAVTIIHKLRGDSRDLRPNGSGNDDDSNDGDDNSDE